MPILADLIPAAFFDQSSTVLWLYTLGAIAALVFGADRAVAGAARLAATLGMSKVIIGATVVSLGTTTPEAFVSVLAALQGEPGLALGNGVGSIICDTALIFGTSCLLVRLPMDRFVLNRHGWLQFGAALLLVAVAGTSALAAGSLEAATIPRLAGVGFVLLLVGYMVLSVHWARQHPKAVALPDEPMPRPRRRTFRSAVRSLAVAFAGLALVAAASQVLVGSVSRLCARYGVPPDVLAVIVVAFGTSLPELVTAIASILKGHPEVLVGNVIGADVLNVLFVVGLSATARPLAVAPLFFWLHFPVMVAAVGLLRIYVWTGGRRFSRWHALPLLALFAGYYAAMVLVVGVPLPGAE